MKVFLFGTTGFIGSAVAEALIAGGHEVLALVRSSANANRVRATGAVPVRGDLREPGTWKGELASCDAAIQLAAAFDGDLASLDALWVRTVIEASRERSTPLRVLYTGGCWLFSERAQPPTSEQDPFDPLPAFAYMVDHRSMMLSSGVDIVTIHPGMVWSEDGGCVGDIVNSVYADREVEIVGSPAVTWPLVHVSDLAQLFRVALEAAKTGTDYLGVTDWAVPIQDIVNYAEIHCARHASIRVITTEQAVNTYGEWAAGRARSQNIETDKARRELGWSPRRRFTDLLQ